MKIHKISKLTKFRIWFFNTKVGELVALSVAILMIFLIGYPFYYISKIFKTIGLFGFGKFYSAAKELKDWQVWSSDMRDLL